MNWPLWFHLQVVESNSIFCLKMHEEMIFNLKSVSEQWNKKLSSGSHIVLGKYFNFYFYLEKAELIENYSLVYLPLLQISYSQSY